MSSSQNKIIYFRFDFGGFIGMGHLSRCTTIAEGFLAHGYRPVFIIRKRPSVTNVTIPFEVIWLDESPDVPSVEVETWKSGAENDELYDFLNVVRSPSLVILDHYALRMDWQSGVKNAGHRLVLIQDLVSTNFNADAVVNYTINSETFFNRLTNQSTQFLAGSDYTPVNSVFTSRRFMHFIEGRPLNNVGIYMGGVRPQYLELLAMALSKSQLIQSKKIDWVVNSIEEKKIITEASDLSSLTIHLRMPSLITLYENSHFFIGACGVASFERAYLGILQGTFSIAENQNDTVQGMKSRDFGFYLGDIRKLTQDEIMSSIESVLNSSEKLKFSKTKKFFDAIDGLGVSRIVKAVESIDRERCAHD